MGERVDRLLVAVTEKRTLSGLKVDLVRPVKAIFSVRYSPLSSGSPFF